MSTDKDNQIRNVENEPVSAQHGAEKIDNQIGDNYINYIELRKTIEEKEDQIRSNVAESESLRKELAEEHQVTCGLQQRLNTLRADLTKERERGEKVREQAGLLSTALVETEALLRQKRTRLERIEASTGWRLEQRYHAFADRLFP